MYLIFLRLVFKPVYRKVSFYLSDDNIADVNKLIYLDAIYVIFIDCIIPYWPET